MRDFFSFENLKGDYPQLGQDLLNGLPAAAFGLSDPQKYLIASLFAGRAVYLAPDALAAKRAAEAIRTLSGKQCALLTAKDEVLTYRKAGSKDALYSRLTALYEWREGADILVCDIEAAVQLVPETLPVFRLQTGKETEMRALVEALTLAGYRREYTVKARARSPSAETFSTCSP